MNTKTDKASKGKRNASKIAPVESVADFKARLAAMDTRPRATGLAVRSETDEGYHPPARAAKEGTAAPEAREEAVAKLVEAAEAVLEDFNNRYGWQEGGTRADIYSALHEAVATLVRMDCEGGAK